VPSDILEAWKKNCEVNYLLLDGIPAKAMADQYTPRTRTVAAQFAHVHNVRIYQLKHRAPKRLGSLETFDRGAQPTGAQLKKALKVSDKAVASMLAEFEAAGKVRGWRGSPVSYLGYFLAHEGHHRALTLVCLRFGGTKMPDSIKYGIWDAWRK